MSDALARRKAQSARLYLDLFGQGRLESADQIMLAETISHGPGVPPTIGTESIKRQATLARRAISDLEVCLEDQVAEGDRVASRWLVRGTHTGTFELLSGPVPASGASIAFGEIRIDRFDGDRIVESWILPDRLTLWQQLGLLPLPPR